jgi:hypothetical protein
VLVVLPLLKASIYFLYSSYLSQCPWDKNIGENKNAVMLMVTLSTVYSTVYVILITYLSRGWMLSPEGQYDFGTLEIESQEAASLSLIIGGIYVTHCAYYLTLDLAWL